MIYNNLSKVNPLWKCILELKNGDFLIKHLGDRYYLILLHATIAG